MTRAGAGPCSPISFSGSLGWGPALTPPPPAPRGVMLPGLSGIGGVGLGLPAPPSCPSVPLPVVAQCPWQGREQLSGARQARRWR